MRIGRTRSFARARHPSRSRGAACRAPTGSVGRRRRMGSPDPDARVVRSATRQGRQRGPRPQPNHLSQRRLPRRRCARKQRRAWEPAPAEFSRNECPDGPHDKRVGLWRGRPTIGQGAGCYALVTKLPLRHPPWPKLCFGARRARGDCAKQELRNHFVPKQELGNEGKRNAGAAFDLRPPISYTGRPSAGPPDWFDMWRRPS